MLTKGMVLLLAAFVSSACSSGSGSSPASDPIPSTLTGMITEIERGDSDEIVGMVLDSNGEEWFVGIAEDVEYGFDLEHLQEHMDQDLPVTVSLEERDGDLVALTVEDA